MPYIDETRRGHIKQGIDRALEDVLSCGDLNYAITRLCDGYLTSYPETYSAYNEVVGALECAKQELYRRLIAPYENKKIKENGDVYDKSRTI